MRRSSWLPTCRRRFPHSSCSPARAGENNNGDPKNSVLRPNLSAWIWKFKTLHGAQILFKSFFLWHFVVIEGPGIRIALVGHRMKNLFDGGYYMIRALMLVAMLFCVGATLGAATIDCTTAAPPLSLSASFTNTGSAAGTETETIVLTNTATCFAQDPTQVLTGLGFDYSGPTLTPFSATASELVDVSTGKQVLLSTNADVGGGWQYLTGISFQGDNAGISSTGLGVFGPGGNFTPTATNNCGNTMLDGLACGILPTGDGTTGLAADAAGGITGHGPLAY